jgi:hypothetical protein
MAQGTVPAGPYQGKTRVEMYGILEQAHLAYENEPREPRNPTTNERVNYLYNAWRAAEDALAACSQDFR